MKHPERGDLLSALFFLQSRSLWNSLLLRLKRLKQPKYLVGGLVGLAWLFWSFGGPFFLRGLNRRHSGPATGPAEILGLGPDAAAVIEGLGASLLAVWVFFCWVIPSSRAALQFTEAEIAFLFPAPFSRRRLIHYKILRWQLGLLITSLVFTLVTGRFARDGAWFYHVFGWWIVLFTLNLHGLAASFTMTRLMDAGMTPWRRRLWLMGLAALGGAAVYFLAQRFHPETLEVEGFLNQIRSVLESPLGYWLLWPFRLVLRPALADSGGAFLAALLPALILLAIQYLWVLWSEVSFEEASLAVSQRRAEVMAAARANNWQAVQKPKKPRRDPFPLPADGFPPVALLWKNLISAGAVFTGRAGIFMGIWVVFTGVLMGSSSNQGLAGVLLAVAALALFLVTIMGAQLFRNDLRQDFAAVDWLRQFPIPGWQIALGELLAPALLLTALQWGLVVTLVGLSIGVGVQIDLQPMQRVSLGVCLAILAPAYNLVTLLVPNLATVMFPAWFQTGREGPAGLEVMGQRLLFTFGTLLAVVVSLVPAGLVFGLVWWVLGLLVSPWVAAPFGAVAAALVLLTEAGLGIFWLGKLFDRIDITNA